MISLPCESGHHQACQSQACTCACGHPVWEPPKKGKGGSEYERQAEAREEEEE